MNQLHNVMFVVLLCAIFQVMVYSICLEVGIGLIGLEYFKRKWSVNNIEVSKYRSIQMFVHALLHML